MFWGPPQSWCLHFCWRLSFTLICFCYPIYWTWNIFLLFFFFHYFVFHGDHVTDRFGTAALGRVIERLRRRTTGPTGRLFAQGPADGGGAETAAGPMFAAFLVSHLQRCDRMEQPAVNSPEGLATLRVILSYSRWTDGHIIILRWLLFIIIFRGTDSVSLAHHFGAENAARYVDQLESGAQHQCPVLDDDSPCKHIRIFD